MNTALFIYDPSPFSRPLPPEKFSLASRQPPSQIRETFPSIFQVSLANVHFMNCVRYSLGMHDAQYSNLSLLLASLLEISSILLLVKNCFAQTDRDI